MNGLGNYLRSKRTLVTFGSVAGILVAASQWYLYDAIHQQAERFTYYLATCAYLCGVLAPAVLWLGRRWPINSRTWKVSVCVHVGASLFLTGIGVLLEATAGWFPHARGWPYSAALQHYFTQHTQISILAYWSLLGAVHLYRMYDQARRHEVAAAQLEAQLRDAHLTVLRNQLQPHFLFNTLQAATASVYGDPEGAEEILLALSELLRTSLRTFERQEISVREEIEFVRSYARIQQRRFGDRLRFEFYIDEKCWPCAVPTLLLQPLIENAIQHGIGLRKEPDVITVRAWLDPYRLNIEIQNLASTLNDLAEKLLSRGVGLANTIARLQNLYDLRQSFVIRNVEPRGVVVSLSLPARVLTAETGDVGIYEHSSAYC